MLKVKKRRSSMTPSPLAEKVQRKSGSSTVSPTSSACPVRALPPMFFCFCFFFSRAKNSHAFARQQSCRELRLSIDEMKSSLSTLAALRSEADTLHQRSVDESDQRDAAARELIESLKAEIASLTERISTLESKPDQSMPEQEQEQEQEREQEEPPPPPPVTPGKVSPPPPPPPKTPGTVPPPPPPETPAISSQKSIGRRTSLARTPAFPHTPISSARRAVRASIAMEAIPPPPPREPAPEPPTTRMTLDLYAQLTGLTAVWKGENHWECTFANREAGRAIQFELVVGESSVEYTPTKIDVPDEVSASVAATATAAGVDGELGGCMLSEAVTEAIEFDRSQLPVFLSKLIEELYA